jgi:cytosine/adenosine deaminase-related metal-dependent hydrolase
MVTIDGARAFGLDKQIGSLESGKKADIILVDMFKPHLVPIFTEWDRVVFEASGHDVDTVMVDGKILMKHRKVTTVNEVEVMERAQVEADKMVEKAGVQPFMQIHENFWGHSRY